MRSFIIGLSLLTLGLSPSLAQVPCTHIDTPTKKRTTIKTPGYEPVLVMVQVPVAEGVEVSAVAKKAFVRLGVSGRYAVRSDVDYGLAKVTVCTFTPTPTIRTDKTYLTVRAEVVWKWNREDSYTVQAQIYLPKKLVAAAPVVQSEMPDGTLIEGRWERRSYESTTFQKATKGRKAKSITVRKTVAMLVVG